MKISDCEFCCFNIRFERARWKVKSEGNKGYKCILLAIAELPVCDWLLEYFLSLNDKMVLSVSFSFISTMEWNTTKQMIKQSTENLSIHGEINGWGLIWSQFFWLESKILLLWACGDIDTRWQCCKIRWDELAVEWQ